MKTYSVQYELYNTNTGMPLGKSPYLILLSDGSKHFGYTNEEGMTINIVRLSPVTSQVFTGQEALEKSGEI